MFFGFAGEADDERRANGDAWDASANPGDEIDDVLAGRFAAHREQHLGVNVLQRDVDVARHFFAASDGRDEFVAEMGGVRVEQANPEIAVDLVDRFEQMNQRNAAAGIHELGRAGFFFPEIHSVIGRVLADEVELLHAFRDQIFDFSDNAMDRAGAMFAAHLRDDAKRARMIAALGDFHVSRMRRRQPKPRRVVVGNVNGLARDEIQRLPAFIGDL